MSCRPLMSRLLTAFLPVALLAWLLVVAPARADDATAVPPAAAAVESAPAPARAPLAVPDTCRGYHVHDPRWFDRAQGYFSQRACTPAVWFDRFFGDEREEDVASALVRVIPSIQYSDRDFTDSGVIFKARVNLPNLKNRFNVVVNDDADEAAGLLPGEAARPEQANAPGRETSAALRYLVRKAGQSGIDVDLGLRSQLKFFARGRYYRTWTHSPVLQTRFTQSAFFRDGDGFGETSLYEVEHMLADDRLLRWSNQLTATEDLGGMQWRDALMLLHQLDRDRALSWTVGMTADSEPAWKDSTYFASVRYRQRAFRSWFFFEIEPFVDGIRKDNFNTNPGIAFRIELWLGDSRGSNSGIEVRPAPRAADDEPVAPAPAAAPVYAPMDAPMDAPTDAGATEITSPTSDAPSAAP